MHLSSVGNLIGGTSSIMQLNSSGNYCLVALIIQEIGTHNKLVAWLQNYFFFQE